MTATAAPAPATALHWSTWVGTRHRHAGANDGRLRASEPPVPDVSGDKYFVLGGSPSGVMSLLDAVERLLDRDDPADRVVVVGSHRPVVGWHEDARRRRGLRIDWVGASSEEARAVQNSDLLAESGADLVILRIRMRRSTLERIKRAAESVRIRTADPEARAGKYMSTWALAVLLDALDAVEAEVAAIRAAGFTGSTPKT